MIRVIRFAAAALPLVLAGCQMTAFESLPQGTIAECPTPLVGAWLAQVEKRDEPADFGIVIHADCTVESRSKGSKHPAAGALPRLTPFKAADDDVVMVETAAVYDLAEIKPSKDEQPRGFMVFAWKRIDASIELRGVDDRRVATLIVQGAVQGETRASQHNRQSEIENFVTEDAAGTARVLTSLGLFDERNPLRFRRVGDDAKALERSMRFASGKKGNKS